MTDETGEAEEDARDAARQRKIADACLDSGSEHEGRLGLYRRLIQGNLAAVTRRLIPRTAAALDAAVGGSYAAWFARFLAEAGPRTPYLRDVPVELVTWARPLWQATTLPAFLGDLARYEIDLFELDAAPQGPAPPPLAEVALDRRLVFAAPRKLARFEHDVLELSPELPRRDTWLLMHRDAEHAVHSTLLATSAALWIEQTLDGVPFGAALARTADGATRSEAERLEVARVLADLAAKGALLGGDAS
jgi:uncharacterized protein